MWKRLAVPALAVAAFAPAACSAGENEAAPAAISTVTVTQAADRQTDWEARADNLTLGQTKKIIDWWDGGTMSTAAAKQWVVTVCGHLENGTTINEIVGAMQDIPHENPHMEIITSYDWREGFVATVMHEACPELNPGGLDARFEK